MDAKWNKEKICICPTFLWFIENKLTCQKNWLAHIIINILIAKWLSREISRLKNNFDSLAIKIIIRKIIIQVAQDTRGTKHSLPAAMEGVVGAGRKKAEGWM